MYLRYQQFQLHQEDPSHHHDQKYPLYLSYLLFLPCRYFLRYLPSPHFLRSLMFPQFLRFHYYQLYR
jgi:hypothetical protein